VTAPRLATSVLVGALVRKAEGEGGFAAVLAKGDATSGSVIVVLMEKAANTVVYERMLQPDGRYAWVPSLTQAFEKPAEVPELIARRRRFDPDLWVLELDIPSIERFAAEMNSIG
jgi:hypothetical protein